MPNNWQTVLDEIKSSVSDMAFKTYFTNIKFISNEGSVVAFSVPNSFVKSSIEKKYYDHVINALKTAGFDCESFNIVVDDQPKKTVIRRGVEIIPGAPVKKKTDPIASVGSILKKTDISANNGLRPNYRLDNYVVGGNNDVAVGAARAIIDNPVGFIVKAIREDWSSYSKTNMFTQFKQNSYNYEEIEKLLVINN